MDATATTDTDLDNDNDAEIIVGMLTSNRVLVYGVVP
jgi:hypothetical protein